MTKIRGQTAPRLLRRLTFIEAIWGRSISFLSCPSRIETEQIVEYLVSGIIGVWDTDYSVSRSFSCFSPIPWRKWNILTLVLVRESGVPVLTVIILMTCCGGDYFTCVHSSCKLTHDDHIQYASEVDLYRSYLRASISFLSCPSRIETEQIVEYLVSGIISTVTLVANTRCQFYMILKMKETNLHNGFQFRPVDHCSQW